MGSERVTNEQAQRFAYSLFDKYVASEVQDLAADLLDARVEIERLRAALRRCHTLLQDAGHWIDMDAHADWHAAMDVELLACDETGVCPTVARPQPGEGERERFEEWAKDEGYYVFNDPINDDHPIYYTEENVRCMWQAWQAARILNRIVREEAKKGQKP